MSDKMDLIEAQDRDLTEKSKIYYHSGLMGAEALQRQIPEGEAIIRDEIGPRPALIDFLDLKPEPRGGKWRYGENTPVFQYTDFTPLSIQEFGANYRVTVKKYWWIESDREIRYSEDMVVTPDQIEEASKWIKRNIHMRQQADLANRDEIRYSDIESRIRGITRYVRDRI